MTVNNSVINVDTSVNRVNWKLNGSNDQVNVNRSTFAVTDNQTDTINGGENILNLGNHDTINGNNNTFNVGANATENIYGEANTINATNGDIINVGNTRSSPYDIVYMTGGTLNAGASSSVALSGASDYFNGAGNDRLYLLRGAWGTTVTTHDSDIYVDSSQSAVNWTLNGSHNVVYAGSSTFTVTAHQTDTINANGATIRANDGDVLTIIGSNNNVCVSGNVSVTFQSANAGNKISHDPVVLNLHGEPVQTVGLDQSSAYFDVLNNGTNQHTAWVTRGEGLLVDDVTGSGRVASEKDLVSGYDQLTTLDGNGDGILDFRDARWSELKLWTDTSGTGTFKPGDLHTLDQIGIAAIDLHPQTANTLDHDNLILDEGTFVWKNGAVGRMAAVGLVSDGTSAGFFGAAKETTVQPMVTAHHDLFDFSSLLAAKGSASVRHAFDHAFATEPHAAQLTPEGQHWAELLHHPADMHGMHDFAHAAALEVTGVKDNLVPHDPLFHPAHGADFHLKF